MRSNKPNAKDFQKWVTNEVLPQIRKTGGYVPIDNTMTNEDILAKAYEIVFKTVKEKDNIIAEQQRVKSHITAGREGTLFSKTGVLTQKVDRLEIELDKSKDYASIKRMTMAYHGTKFNWRMLKEHSTLMEKEPIDIFDANYGTVKAYHKDVWTECYGLDII